MTRSELADVRVRAERMLSIFGREHGVGRLIADLLDALDACLAEARKPS